MLKAKAIKYIDLLILFFLGLHIIASQWSVAASSIGLGGLIITGAVRIFTGYVYKPDKILIILFLILVFFHLLSSAFSVNPEESFILSKRIFLYFTFFAVMIFIRNKEDLKYFLMIFLIFTFIISSIEIFKYFEYKSSLVNVPQFDIRLREFGYPVTNGQIKMTLLIIFISLLLTKKKFGIPLYFIYITLIPLILTFYFTNTRGAFLGLISGVVVIGILRNKYVPIGVISLVILFLIFAPDAYKERIVSIADMEHPSNKSRIVMWETGLKIIADHPFTGIGDTDLRPVYTQYKKLEYHGEASHMHNNILQMAVQMGIPGLLSWLVLMGYILVRSVKIFIQTKHESELNILAVISIASFTALQISGLTEYNFGDFEYSAVLWFSLGLALFSEKLMNEMKPEKFQEANNVVQRT